MNHEKQIKTATSSSPRSAGGHSGINLPAVPVLQHKQEDYTDVSDIQVNRQSTAFRMPVQRIVDGSASQKQPIVSQLKPFRPPIQLMTSAKVVQLIDDGELDELMAIVTSGTSTEFGRKFRGVEPGMDEWISCKTTYDNAKALVNAGKNTEARDLIRQSSDLRMPTSHMARNLDTDTDDTRIIHPTSKDTLPYDAPLNSNGNPRWLNHTSTDRKRRDYVDEGDDATEMVDRAVEFSTRYWVQPPFASNSKIKLDQTDPTHMEAHRRREENKKKHSKFDPTKTQPIDAPWNPDLTAPPSPYRK